MFLSIDFYCKYAIIISESCAITFLHSLRVVMVATIISSPGQFVSLVYRWQFAH